MLLLTINSLNLDMALDEPMPPTPTDVSLVDEKKYYKKWVKVNKVILKIILTQFQEALDGP